MTFESEGVQRGARVEVGRFGRRAGWTAKWGPVCGRARRGLGGPREDVKEVRVASFLGRYGQRK